LTGDRAAIGRDGGQDTQGAWQGSYQVTIRPTGRCAPESSEPADSSTPVHTRPLADEGEIESKSQAGPNDIENGKLD
jgi:hypothetical protein